MLRLSVDSKYDSAKVLKELPRNQLVGLKKNYDEGSTLQNTLQKYQKENYELKIRCGKIDQIEKYVHILVETNENLKKTNSEYQRKNNELMREIDHIKRQKTFGEQMKNLRSRTFNNDGIALSDKRKNDFDDSFSNVKMQQQIASERLRYENMMGVSESKHSRQIQQLELQLSNLGKQYEMERNHQKKEIQNLISQNKQLRIKNNSQEQDLALLKIQDQKLELQLRKYMTLAEQNKIELAKKSEIIARLQSDSHKNNQMMSRDIQTFRLQLQKVQGEKAMFQRLTNQLKQEGATLLSDVNELKQIVLQLQEIKCANMRHIQKIESDLKITSEKSQFLSTQLEESEHRHKHMISSLEKEVGELRIKRQTFQVDLHTKQNQIHDLIKIVATLEEKEKGASTTSVHLKQANIKMTQRLKELEDKMPLLEELSVRCEEKERYAAETQKNYVDLKTQLVQMQLIYQKENGRVKELDKLLEQEICNTKIVEEQKQLILQKGRERENLLKESQKCIDQCQKVYIIEKQNHAVSKSRVNELEQTILMMENKLKQTVENLENKQEEEKKRLMNEGLENMEKIVTQKYELILNQQAAHFRTKIQYLQNQIILLQKAPSEPHSLDDI